MKISSPAYPTYLADNMAHGMSLRDYFAAVALPVIMKDWYDNDLMCGDDLNAETIANLAYVVSDFMLAERNK